MTDETRFVASVRDWPAAMRRSTAARYLDLTMTEFDHEVAGGRLPLPFKLGRGERWKRDAIDRALAVIVGEIDDDWRSRQPAYGGGDWRKQVKAYRDEP